MFSSRAPLSHSCAAARPPARPGVDRLEPRMLLAGDVVISEFLAINGNNLPDEDGEFSDWVELQNVGSAPVNLDGWYLTDNATNLTRWRFPAVTIEPGGFMLVFASDKNRKVPGQPLHTNFKLDGGGEYLALIMPDGVTPSYEFAPAYPAQESNISYGTGAEAPITTALVPTPAAATYLIPADGSLGTGWTAVDFDDAAWTGGQTAVGFEVGAGGTPAVLPAEQEPNDSVAAADDASTNFLPAPAGGGLYQLVVKGDTTPGDDDFYNIGRLEAGDVVSISHWGRTTNRGTLGDPFVELYRGNPASPTFVTSNDDTMGLDSFLHRLTVPASDTYYINARAYNDGYSGSYALSVWLENAAGTPAPGTAGPAPAESEPNDAASAADIVSGGWRAAQYRSSTAGTVSGSGAGATDFFKYRFTAGDLVTVMVDSLSGLNATAALYNTTGTVVLAQDMMRFLGPDAASDARLLAYRIPADGVYYVQVASGNETSGAYRLDVYLSTNTPPASGSSYGGVIRTDLEAAMYGRSATAYVRVPFSYSAAGLPEAASLALSVQYDDGFVAYLNGTEVARRNAPAGALPHDAAAVAERPQPQSMTSETIDLTAFRALLVEGENVLALHGLNSAAGDDDFLLLPRLELSSRPVLPPPSYFTIPTPGGPNDGAPINLGPQISNVSHAPPEPADDEDVVVTAKVSAPGTGVSQVTLKYRVMFNAEVSVPMLDDGAHGDGAAGDGVYGAAIPAAVTANGRMLRYAIAAADTGGRTSRAPLHAAANSPEYYGTVVRNDAVWASPVPVFHFFTQNPTAATTRSGTRASVYYDGEFYDNVFVRDRGGFSSDGFKFDFNPGDRFRWWDRDDAPPGATRVDEINLNYNSAYDETRLRASLAFETFAAAGVPSLTSFPMRMQQNGALFKLATFVENPDAEYLDRVGLDGRNPMYKPISDDPQMTSAFRFDKLTARSDGNSDLQAFLDGIHTIGPLRQRFIFDNVDLPAFLNYWAANTIVNDNDNVQKNYLLYRDTTGDGEWMFLPWDKDLTFGKHWGIPDYGARDPQTHPFFGDAGHPKMDGPHAYNYLINVLLSDVQVRSMYLRRLRTLMDRLLQPASTPVAQRHFERRLDEMFAQISADPAAASTVGGAEGLRASLDNIRDLYLQARRNHLYVNHSENINYPDYAGIPSAQPASAPIDIVTLDYNPASGNQDQEYVQLTNPNNFAVDLSGWKFAGAVDYVFPEGAVIAPRRSMYVARDLAAFRARTVGPAGGQGLFAIGGYDGQLSARGETLVLTDAAGATVDTYTWNGTPTGAQQALRVTEVMYHPHDAPNNTPLDENFEYIEFQNISGQPVNLAGVKFTQGVNVLLGDVTLQPGAYALVVKNRAAFTARYGAAAAERIVGEYPLDILDNGGERVRLEDASGEVVLDFHFDHDWYASTDGLGRSLIIRNPNAPVGTWGDGPSWRPSGARGGSPGSDDAADVVVPTVDVVDVTPDPRTTPVESIVIAFSEPVYGLDLADLDLTRNGVPVALTTAQSLASTDGGATWTLGNLGALTAAGGRYVLALRRDGTGVADYGGNPLAAAAEEAWGVPMPPAAVVRRHLFYNNSTYDGRAATGAADDAAVAPDKVALLPGQTATLANVTNYAGGINGVVIDVSGLRGNPGAADFVFQVSGRSLTNLTWGAAPAPASVTRRPGAGAGGADRITLTWADGAIVDRWLRVTLKASEITGLAADDVFHFGNLVGETGDVAGAATVSANDVARTRARHGSRSAMNGWFDFNRDGRVNAIDQALARSHVRRSLPMFAAPGAAAASFGDSPILPPAATPAPRRGAYRPATDLLA